MHIWNKQRAAFHAILRGHINITLSNGGLVARRATKENGVNGYGVVLTTEPVSEGSMLTVTVQSDNQDFKGGLVCKISTLDSLYIVPNVLDLYISSIIIMTSLQCHCMNGHN